MTASPSATEIDSLMKRSSHNLAMAWLSYNPSPPLKQPSGLMTLTTEFSENPAEAWWLLIQHGVPRMYSSEWRDRMFKAAPLLRERYENMATRLVVAEGDATGEQLGREGVRAKGMRGLNFMDTANSTAAFGVFVEKAKVEHPDWTPEQIDAEAGWRTTLAVSRTQNASVPLDYADLALQGRWSPGLRLWTMFKSEPYATYNMFLRAVRRYGKSDRGFKAKAKLLHDGFLVLAL